jgi:hypothetical protein
VHVCGDDFHRVEEIIDISIFRTNKNNIAQYCKVKTKSRPSSAMCGLSALKLYLPVMIPLMVAYVVASPFIYLKEKADHFFAIRRLQRRPSPIQGIAPPSEDQTVRLDQTHEHVQ